MSQTKPSSHHRLAGSYRASRHDKFIDSDPVAEGFPEPPESLQGEALDRWHYIRNAMESTGLIRAADQAHLAIYCELWSEFKDKPSEFQAAKIAQFIRLGNDLYLTSVARAKIPAPPTDGETNPFDAFKSH